MNVKIKGILFDIGGVIVRTDDLRPRENLARRFGMNREEIDQLVFQNPAAQAAERGEGSEAAVWETVQAALNLTPAQLVEFQTEFWRGDAADAALLDLLASLRPGCRTGLLTNSWLRSPLELFWKRFKLPEARVRLAVDVVVSSAEVGVQKPAPRIYAAALERLGTLAPETVFVDDNAANVDAARRLGFEAVLFENPAQARRDLLALLAR